MLDPDNQNLMETVGAGSAIGIALTLLYKFIVRLFRMEKPEASKDNAESTLYDNLRAEISRMSEDLRDMKERHEVERAAFEIRVKGLESEIIVLHFKFREAQSQAVEAYAITKGLCLKNKECAETEQVSMLLKKIIGLPE